MRRESGLIIVEQVILPFLKSKKKRKLEQQSPLLYINKKIKNRLWVHSPKPSGCSSIPTHRCVLQTTHYLICYNPFCFILIFLSQPKL